MVLAVECPAPGPDESHPTGDIDPVPMQQEPPIELSIVVEIDSSGYGCVRVIFRIPGGPQAATHNAQPADSAKPQDGGQPEKQYQWVRKQLLHKGWSLPAHNLLVAYFDSCERNGVQANTGVTWQLLKRVRETQGLPVHVFAGLALEEKVALVLQHFDPEDLGSVSARRLFAMSRTLDPLRPESELVQRHPCLGRCSPGCTDAEQLPRETCQTVLEEVVSTAAAAGTADAAELEQGLLELMTTAFVFKDLSREGKFKALFRLLDRMLLGQLEAKELSHVADKCMHYRQCLAADVDVEADELAMQELQEQAAAVPQGRVGKQEAARLLLDLTRGWPNGELDRVLDMAQENTATRCWTIDMSNCCIGDKGLQPLLAALEQDDAFDSINLSRCNLRNAGAQALANLLGQHPSVTAVNLKCNSISAGGAAALEQLLRDNPRITYLDISENLVTRGFSRTHAMPGPPACEDAISLSRQLSANQESRPKTSREVVTHLREHASEVRSIFTSMMDERNLAPIGGLIQQLVGAAEAWGIRAEDMLTVLRADRLLRGPDSITDTAGEVWVTFGEFMLMVSADSATKRVCKAILHHLQEAKEIFFRIRDPASKAVAFDLYARKLLEAATGPGNTCWGVSGFEAEAALNQDILLACAKLAPEASGSSTISWTQFVQAVLRLYNELRFA